jgi:hypothetical protein
MEINTKFLFAQNCNSLRREREKLIAEKKTISMHEKFPPLALITLNASKVEFSGWKKK